MHWWGVCLGWGSGWTCPPGSTQAEMALGWWGQEGVCPERHHWSLSQGSPSRPGRDTADGGNSQCRGLEAGRGSQGVFWEPGALREACKSWRGQRG